MENQQGRLLLEKFKNGTINPEELALLEAWYNEYADTARPFDNVEAYVNSMQKMDASFPFESKPKTFVIWKKVTVAAAVATIILGAGVVFFNNQPKQDTQQITAANDIAPGKQGATLTLANGEKIHLSDAANGELAQQVGVTVTKTSGGQLIYSVSPLSGKMSGGQRGEEGTQTNTLSTAKGETYQLRLPDGSLVWLNAASSLTYTANLNERGKRRVRLDGEGYFEIAKDKAHPFIVESRGQEVEVLGTHFNVNAYTGEPGITTTLLEGSVKLNSITKGTTLAILKPGDQASFSGSRALVSKAADPEEVTAWKNGYFKFSDNLESIMNKIARWYDVEVVYQIKPDPDYTFGGEISRSRNLSEVLKVMEYSGKVHFKIEGRRVIVNK